MLNNSRYNQSIMLKSVDISILEPIFWDVDFEVLSWEKDRDFIIQRVLTHGNLQMIRWLREMVGNETLSTWIQVHRGRGLTARQLRYWEVILELPISLVNQWIRNGQQSTWGQRVP